ncbi:hypothetical protein EDB19DRAFT_781034 [Suillus lakei]|nr:hypothetical protein EDB19DRAFT_781034 [Suillus lakei]
MTYDQTQSWQLACLVCKPNAVIETREVRAEGGAMMSVRPLSEGKQLTRQGNLFPLDTTTMLSIALSGMMNAGPSNYNATMNLGSQPQVKFLFGSKQINSWPGTSAGSGSDIMLQSASKAYLSGYLGATYVPARLSAIEVVFMSSLPLVVISAATFLLLYIFLGLLRFQKKREEFTLPNVARIIHGSNLPEEMSLLAQELDDGTGICIEQDVIGRIGDRTVVLRQRDNGSDVLQFT